MWTWCTWTAASTIACGSSSRRRLTWIRRSSRRRRNCSSASPRSPASPPRGPGSCRSRTATWPRWPPAPAWRGSNSANCATGPRSQNDYIELARLYHTIFISNIPEFTGADEDAARRFIAAIDEFYDRGVKIVVSAAAAPAALYRGERLQLEFQRAASRLIEMQTQQYLAGRASSLRRASPSPGIIRRMKTVAEFKIHYRQILDPSGEAVAPLPPFAQGCGRGAAHVSGHDSGARLRRQGGEPAAHRTTRHLSFIPRPRSRACRHRRRDAARGRAGARLSRIRHAALARRDHDGDTDVLGRRRMRQ